MGLLLDDEDDYYTPPVKVARVERESAAKGSVRKEESTPECGSERKCENKNINNGDVSAQVRIPLRGGNGIEKMAAFAFAAGHASVKLVDVSTAGGGRGRSSTTTSQRSPISSEQQLDNPLTVPKAVAYASQNFSTTTADATPNGTMASATTEFIASTPSCTPEGPMGSSAGVSAVSRTLFVDDGAKNVANFPVATTKTEGGEGAPRPRVQMNLFDFFRTMACTKK